MLKILIATKPDDADSYYVKLALEKLGHHVVLWFPADIPTMQVHSFILKNHDMKWSSQGLDLDIHESDEFDIVWRRRPARPKLNDLVHPDDLKNATNENNAFYDAFWHTIEPNAFWINPVVPQMLVNCKLSQLKFAAEVGMNVPETIVTNDPSKIKEFIASRSLGDTIYKTLYPVLWTTDNSMRLTYTSPITLDELPSESTLKLTPAIYQKKIEKAYELRVTCMGNTAIAVKLFSQEHHKGINDWRGIPARELKMEPYEMPSSLANQCFELMRKFGIVFGCFDFIVTPEGDYVFLEVNEQGQFLWQEEYNPKIKLLDPFVHFLIERNPNFVWNNASTSVIIPEFYEGVKVQQRKAMEQHIDPGLPI